MEKQEAFKRVLKTLKNNKSMVESREDGIYIILAGKEEKGEAFTLDWGKVYSLNGKSNIHSHAQKELDILVKTTPDAIIAPFTNEIIALCEAFGKSGQSGGSTPYTAGAISQAVKKLMLFETISPLTGGDDEWNDVSGINNGEPMFQNNRDSRIFKDGKDGQAYFIEAIVFDGDIGGRFTGNGSVNDIDGNNVGSTQYIKSFPFEPKTFYVDVIDHRWKDKDEKIPDGNGDWWTHSIKDESQLKEVFEYYDKLTS
jgi:hypothetical protein